MTKFIGDNKNYLRQFENNYCLILNAAVNVHKNEAVFDALRTIGVVLLVREVRCVFFYTHRSTHSYFPSHLC